MRTTLDIEPDVMAAVREMARQQNVAVGKVISRLVRQALTGGAAGAVAALARPTVAGFEPFAARGVLVTNELIDQLRDSEGA